MVAIATVYRKAIESIRAGSLTTNVLGVPNHACLIGHCFYAQHRSGALFIDPYTWAEHNLVELGRVVKEQYPEFVATQSYTCLYELAVLFNDKYLPTKDQVCALLEKAAVREEERV